MYDVSDRRLVDELLEFTSLAEARFAANERAGLFLALSGVETDADDVPIASPLSISRLTVPPRIRGSESTLRAMPTHQIVCSGLTFDDHLWSIDGLFWTTSVLLRLRSGGTFSFCEIAEAPWDVIDGAPAGTLVRRLFVGPGPRDWWPAGRVRITDADARWVGDNIEPTLRLRSDKTFQFALSCFHGAFDEQDVRMAVSKAWAGIEGLLRISSELRFRISLLAATVTSPPGESRVAKFSRIASLYDQRSKVVHGAAISLEKVQACAQESLQLLAELIIDAIAHGGVRSAAAIEAALLGALDLD